MKFRPHNRFIICFVLLALFQLVPHLHAEEGLVSMNFENTDLRLVIKFVSEITGENFVVDEGVKGTVTILAPSKVPTEQLRQVLESVLMVSGYTLISSGQLTKVIPLESARQASSETIVSDQVIHDGERFVTQIIPLRFANAEKITSLVNPFLTRGGHVTFYAPTNTLIVSDSAGNVSRISEMVSQLDHKGADVSPDLHVYRLKNADAQEVADVLSQLFDKERKSLEAAASQNKELSFVVADAATNSLLIHTSQGRYPSIQKAVEELDAPRQQVLVEVLVMEINLDKLEHLGIEWATAEGAVYGSQEGFAQNRVIQASDIALNVLTGGGFAGTTAAYLHNDTYKIGTLEIPRLGILVNAFRNNSDINILSTPQILTTDHTEAEILVGENRSFIKIAQVTAEGSTVRTFEYKDIGLSLRLKPHIAENGLVRMEVHQKVEDVIGESFEGAVETSKREARTMITVKDSQTAVIGGLIRDRKDKIITKVPILGDIPFLGIPFTRKTDQNTKTNLLIFICPHILDSQAELSSFTERKREELDSIIHPKTPSSSAQLSEVAGVSKSHSSPSSRARRSGEWVRPLQ